MPVQKSDLVLNLAAFQADATPASTVQLNNFLIEKGKTEKEQWYQVGAGEYRRRRAAGETPFPAPVQLDDKATALKVPSRESGRDIECRVFGASLNNPKGLFYHIHGGGWVLGDAAGQDLLLDEISSKAELVVVSVQYRLAPEYPFPAGPEDCYDVADWLVEHAKTKFGVDMNFIGGESAGGTLTANVLIHLRSRNSLSKIKGSVLSYPCLDLSYLPSIHLEDAANPLILSYAGAVNFRNAYLGHTDQKAPHVSPLYNDLTGLGPALFIVGTKDGLLDDTLLGSARWSIAGNETVVKFVPGGAHGFMTFDGNQLEVTRSGWDVMIEFLREKI